MIFTASQIAALLNGQIIGDSNCKISSLAKIEEAKSGALTFISNPKYEQYLSSTEASIVLINQDLVFQKPAQTTLIKVNDAYSAFSVLLEKFNTFNGREKTGIEQPSWVSNQSVMGKEAYIGAFSYISNFVKLGDRVKIHPQVFIGENVEIDDDCILFPGVRVQEGSRIGKRVVVHSGAVIGSDGFGFAPQADGTYSKISQIGNVLIEDDVEIGANTCIDRATVGTTLIRKGVKLDNLIQIAHNVEVGENTVIAAQAGISGSTKIGDRCMIGGQVGIVGHIKMATGTQIGAQSGVNKTLTKAFEKYRGSPAIPVNDSLRSEVIYKNLPKLEKRVQLLEEIYKKEA